MLCTFHLCHTQFLVLRSILTSQSKWEKQIGITQVWVYANPRFLIYRELLSCGQVKFSPHFIMLWSGPDGCYCSTVHGLWVLCLGPGDKFGHRHLRKKKIKGLLKFCHNAMWITLFKQDIACLISTSKQFIHRKAWYMTFYKFKAKKVNICPPGNWILYLEGTIIFRSIE